MLPNMHGTTTEDSSGVAGYEGMAGYEGVRWGFEVRIAGQRWAGCRGHVVLS